MKDVVIIGGGPAGLSAAVYAKRAAMDVIVIEKEPFAGGQIISSEKVENYLGLNGISGFDLAARYREHAEDVGVEFVTNEVKKISRSKDSIILELENGERMETVNIVIATGARHRMLNVPGEKELTGAGVSYCATCDGAFFKNKEVAVVGGGDVALGDALYLSGICSKVYLINRREELRAAKNIQEAVFSKENIVFLPNYVVEGLEGESMLEKIILKNTVSGETKELELSGIFVAIGMSPVTGFAEGIIELDSAGYIIADEDCRTNVKGIYSAGDVRTKALRQLITAVSDGANAVYSIESDMKITGLTHP